MFGRMFWTVLAAGASLALVGSLSLVFGTGLL